MAEFINGTKVYCCYGAYAEVGHDADCKRGKVQKREWPFPSRNNYCELNNCFVSRCPEWKGGGGAMDSAATCHYCGETALSRVDTCNGPGDNPPVDPPSTTGA